MYLPILTRYSSVITFFASAELIKKKEGPYGRNRLSSALQTLMRLPFSTFRARSFLRDPLFFKTTLYADQALPDLHTWHH